MALFGRNDTTNSRSSSMATQGNPIQDQINLVGEGTVFEGTLRAESDVRASGRIVGRLEVTGKAIVAEGGAVDGEIQATNADIAGHVQGEIHVEKKLVLKSTARVDGNIRTDRLVVEEGALFTGECEMGAGAATNGASSGSGADASGAETSASRSKASDASASASASTKDASGAKKK